MKLLLNNTAIINLVNEKVKKYKLIKKYNETNTR